MYPGAEWWECAGVWLALDHGLQQDGAEEGIPARDSPTQGQVETGQTGILELRCFTLGWIIVVQGVADIQLFRFSGLFYIGTGFQL